MDKELIKTIINKLNKSAFSKFIFELWQLENRSNGQIYKETKPLEKIGVDVYEQNYIKGLYEKSENEYQVYNLILPFFYPLELFYKYDNINIEISEIINKLKRYKQLTDDRISGWQFWTDGNYIIPNIKFVTNFVNLSQNIYQDILFPKFQKLIDEINIQAQVFIGSPDSFFELNPSGTYEGFKNFMEKYQKEISISVNERIVSLDYITSEKYLINGVLKSTKFPCEPLFIKKEKDKNEIVKEFEFLINTNESEKKIENFLNIHFKEIFGEHYDRIETQLWLRFPDIDVNNKNRRIDIFLRNCIQRDWELFELKRVKKLYRSYRDIPVFMNEIYTAIQQINNYKRILSQDVVKQKFAEDGIEYFYPEFRLVIGRNPDITTEQWRWLKSSNENNLKIITYDELLSEMKIRLNFQNEIYRKLLQ